MHSNTDNIKKRWSPGCWGGWGVIRLLRGRDEESKTCESKGIEDPDYAVN